MSHKIVITTDNVKLKLFILRIGDYYIRDFLINSIKKLQAKDASSPQ